MKQHCRGREMTSNPWRAHRMTMKRIHSPRCSLLECSGVIQKYCEPKLICAGVIGAVLLAKLDQAEQDCHENRDDGDEDQSRCGETKKTH